MISIRKISHSAYSVTQLTHQITDNASIRVRRKRWKISIRFESSSTSSLIRCSDNMQIDESNSTSSHSAYGADGKIAFNWAKCEDRRGAEGDFWLIKLSHANDWLHSLCFVRMSYCVSSNTKSIWKTFFFCVRNRANKAVGLCIHAIWLDFTIFKQFETENKKTATAATTTTAAIIEVVYLYMNACALIQLNERRHENSMAENERKRKNMERTWKNIEPNTHTHSPIDVRVCDVRTNEQMNNWHGCEFKYVYSIPTADIQHVKCECLLDVRSHVRSAMKAILL